MVSQEEKCTPAISQVRLPLFPSLWLCLWGWGRAGLRGVSGAGSRTNARACLPFPPSGGERAHPCGASRLERLPPPCSSFRGPSHHRARDPADAPGHPA